MPFEITMRGGKVYRGWRAAIRILLYFPILTIGLANGTYVVVRRGWLLPTLNLAIWIGLGLMTAREVYLWWRLAAIAYHLHHPH